MVIIDPSVLLSECNVAVASLERRSSSPIDVPSTDKVYFFASEPVVIILNPTAPFT